MQEETIARFSNHEHLCCASYILTRTRRQHFDTGFEPNVDDCHGTGIIISAHCMLRGGLMLYVLHLYNFLLELWPRQTSDPLLSLALTL